MHRTKLSPKIIEMIRGVLLRPAMYVGKTNYDMVVTFISGYAWGADDHAGLHGPDTFKDFHDFLVAKYATEEYQFSQIGWMGVIPAVFREQGLDDKALIAQLKSDFNDFNNVLVRMAVETSDGDDPSGVENT